jgi:TusA-related sulfurtransferase
MKSKALLITLALSLGLGVAAFAVALAQQPAPAAPAKPAICPCMGEGMQHGMMGGQGMMGGMGRMDGMQPQHRMMHCPMMVPGAKVEIKSTDKGATITITSDDAKAARRIQKMAEMMRLMHELETEK